MRLRGLMLGILPLGAPGWMALTAFRVLDPPTRFHFHSRKGVPS